jgi:hypothetical protein
MIKLKDILAEIFHNIKEASEIQQASPDSSADWLETFNDMPKVAGDVDLLMWWSDVYHDMGNTLAYYKKQIELGYKLTQFHNDIRQLIQHTNKCVDKIRLIVPKAFNNVKQNSLILNNIKDDIVEELKELLKLDDSTEMSAVTDHMEKIADSYATVAEGLIEQTWDSEAESELASKDDFNKYDSANIRIKNPTMAKTPWLTYAPISSADKYSPANVETRNKFLQGYSLMDIYNWWMRVEPRGEGFIMFDNFVKRALYNSLDDNEQLITGKQARDFHEYIRRVDPERFKDRKKL